MHTNAVYHKFITQPYLSLLNSYLFLSRFSVSLKDLNNYFFRGFAYKSLLNSFSVLINYIMWSSNHFSTSSCFLSFLGFTIFRVQVFQFPDFPGSRSGIRVQVLEVTYDRDISICINSIIVRSTAHF